MEFRYQRAYHTRYAVTIVALAISMPLTGSRHALGQETRTAKTNAAQSTLAWPNWMGPNHDGISHETGWSTQWPENGLPLVWSREIGIGFSSVAIGSGRLFTLGHVDGTETVHCLDAESGEDIWMHSYPCKLIDNLYEGGPGATATMDGDLVYTLGKEGQLFCFRADDGEILWEKDLQQDLQVSLPEWGFNCSPYVLNDQLILAGGRVVSYEKTTGVKKWQTDQHVPGYGCVRPFSHEGDTLLAVLDCDALRIIRNHDGSEVDAYPWKSPFRTNSTTPIIHEGTIFVSTGYQVGCGLFRLADEKLELLYDNREMRNHFNNSILHDGHLYGFDGNSNLGRVVHLKCMDHATGEVAWKHRGLGCGSLMIADGKLLILSDDGKLVVAKATPSGFEEIASSPILEGRCWTVPVLLGGRVYARSAKGKLVSVQLPPS